MGAPARAPAPRDATEAFRRQLGISCAEDPAFGWIAEVGLRSALPPRWTSHVDEKSGCLYYVDGSRRSSSWENPLAPALRRVLEAGREYRRQPQDGFFEGQRALLWHEHKSALDRWHGPFADPSGRAYYANAAEGISSWQDPRVEAQYLFELQSSLLAGLEELLGPPRPRAPPQPSPAASAGRGVLSRAGREVLAGAAGAAPAAPEAPGGGPGGSPETPGTPKTPGLQGGTLRLFATQACSAAKEDRRAMLRRMNATVERLGDMEKDELQAQRLNFSKKLRARQFKKVGSCLF